MGENYPRCDRSDEQSAKRRVRFDAEEDGEPSISIVSAVAAATDQDPVEMEPLANVIDTDALDVLVSSDNPDSNLVHISFVYEGTHVTVDSSGLLRIEPEEV